MTEKGQTVVQFPLLNPDRLTRVLQINPAFRKEGPRLTHEVINGKHIFHSYGFGSAATNLAPGAAFLSVKSFNVFVDPTKNPTCAVIGAGIIGLMTAIEITKSGRLVTLYSDIIPQFDTNDSSKLISSQILPQIWMPDSYESQDALRHELMSKLSYDFYKISLNLNRYRSIKKISVYDKEHSIDELKEVVTDYVFDTFKQTKIRYENGNLEDSSAYQTIFINSRLLVEELRIEAILRGVKFVQRKFNSVQEMCSLKQDGVFNCTGSASINLLNDKHFENQPTLVFQFDETENHKREFVLIGKKTQNLNIFCIGKKTYLVMKNSTANLSKDEIREKLSQASKFIDNHRVYPKL